MHGPRLCHRQRWAFRERRNCYQCSVGVYKVSSVRALINAARLHSELVICTMISKTVWIEVVSFAQQFHHFIAPP